MEVVQMRRCRRLLVLGRLQDEFVVLMRFLHKESMFFFFLSNFAFMVHLFQLLQLWAKICFYQ